MTLGPLMIDVAGLTLSPDDKQLLQHPAIGGVILFQRNFDSCAQLCALTEEIHSIRKPPLLIAVDQEGGRVQRFGAPLTILPPAARMGHRYDLDPGEALKLARASGWLMASELVACGVDLSFAPVVDIDHQLCSVIGDRAFHHHPHAVAELSCEFMAGMHEAGMAATAKHFPGHGSVTADSHLTLPVDHRDYVDIADELRPYELLIANGLDAVMMALVSYPAIDERPASFSEAWIQGELRRQLGFGGAIYSDDLTMAGAAGLGDMRSRVKAALVAGCDVVLICNDRDAVVSIIDRVDAISNPASQARLASLHRRHTVTWEKLSYTPRWHEAKELITASLDRPPLELDG